MKVQRIGVSGLLRATIVTPDPDAVILEGLNITKQWRKQKRGEFEGLWALVGERHNAFLNQGLQAIGRRYANIATVPAAPTGIGVSSDNTAVTATTTTFGGTFRYSAFNATFPSIAAQTVSYQSDFTKGSGAGQIDFSVRKLGITNASTDAVGGVQDIIGGAGSSPYNEPLTIDLTSTTSFTFRPQIDQAFTAI
jgi:hypothetical protein